MKDQSSGLKQRWTRAARSVLPVVAAAIGFAGALAGQSPAPPAPVATLNQLMRGLFFPHSNVIFSTQIKNPADIKMISEPSMATDPLNGVFGKWEAVENSALVLTEAADLLTVQGRKCSNGKDVPVGNADWAKFVAQLREAGMEAYKAAQTKDMENMIKVSEVLNNSCANCHNRYRVRNRCQ